MSTRLFERQEKIVRNDPEIYDKEKYLELIEQLNKEFGSNIKLRETIIDTYAEILNYAAYMDHALNYLCGIYSNYVKQMHETTDKSVNSKARVLKNVTKRYLSDCVPVSKQEWTLYQKLKKGDNYYETYCN